MTEIVRRSRVSRKEDTMAADVHECEECGQMCDCDGEDIHNPQPDDCVHHDEHCLEPDDEDEDLTIEA